MRSRLPEMVLVRLGDYGSAVVTLPDPLKASPSRKELRRHRDKLVAVIGAGNWLFETINQVEANWRQEVLDGRTPYDPGDERAIFAYYRQWLKPCSDIRNRAKAMTNRGLRVEGRRSFREYIHQARRIVSGDRPPFTSAASAALWASMVAKHRNPRPVSVDASGRIFEITGARYVFPGLDPESVAEGIADLEAGRVFTLEEVLKGRGA